MIKAIGFDLFNTLMVVHPNALKIALKRVVDSLLESGLKIDPDSFLELHNLIAARYIKSAQASGKETHNSIWISAALAELGYSLDPDDELILKAVEEYFSAFYELSHIIPGTHLLLEELKPKYKLALLSNFTHYPACKKILDKLSLTHYFDVIIISGEFGFRKPHPVVFDVMLHNLGVDRDEVIFVGDDPDSDVWGAIRAGIRPVWTSYVLDQGIPLVPGYLAYKVNPEQIYAYRVSKWQDLKILLKYLE